MGVKGLQAFADDALTSVNIARLADDFSQHRGIKAVLVVDGMGCLRTFYNPDVPWVYGGQWKQFADKVHRFVDAFQQIGIDLVFIFDGTVEDCKIAEWVRRRNEDIKKARKIFQRIRETGRHPPVSLYHLQAGVSSYAVQCLKEYGATVYTSVIEGDRAVFHYYKRHNCFGVLGQDSDFLVFDIENYFSLNSLHLGKAVHVKRYDKMRLCRKLYLQPFHLPLLACLMGNDVIPYDKLRRFHKTITGSFSNRWIDLLPAVAQYLSGLHLTSLTPQVVGYLEQQVFTSEPSMLGLMDQVVRQYTVLVEPVEPNQRGWEEPVQTGILEVIQRSHIHAEITAGLWNVISKHLYQRGPGIEDFTDPNSPSIGTLLKPIRKRIYGLLLGIGRMKPSAKASATCSLLSSTEAAGNLSHSASTLTVGVNAVKEWVVYSGRNLTVQPDITEAEALNMPGGTPSLECLWLQPDTQPSKLQAFLACMHCRIDSAQLLQLPAHFLLPCVLLHYLYYCANPPFLGERDIDAFLAQVVCLQMHTASSLASLTVRHVDPRAVHLATFFMRCVSLGCLANSACCLPLRMSDCMPWRFFDGQLFHLKYLEAHNGASVEELCDRNLTAAEDFRRMKACINDG